MKRGDIRQMPNYYDRYIMQVEDVHLDEALQQSLQALEDLDMDLFRRMGDQVYEPGKWTSRDIFQHMLDTERVMSYRAMRFARKDRTPLPSFDENMFAANAMATKRSLAEIIEELKLVRLATQMLFRSFDSSVMHESGQVMSNEISVLALGFIICGHQAHHLNVIRERYLHLAV